MEVKDRCAQLWAYGPLFLVFLSGLGFSLQGLVIKILEERHNFHGSFQLIVVRGLIQMTVSSLVVYYNKMNGEKASLFGDSKYTSSILLLRAVLGFGGMGFAFLAIEHMPIADASVLVMQSPIIAAVLSYFILGEPWKLAEFTATMSSLVGTILITRPPFLFHALGIHISGSGDEANYQSHSDQMGPVFGMISAFCAGGAFVAVRMLGTTAKMPWANVSLAASLGQFVFSLPCVFLSGQGVTRGNSQLWMLLILGGMIGTASQIAMTIGMQREKSASATGMRSSDILFAFIWEALYTNDPVTALSVLGAILVSLGVMIIVLFKSTTLANQGEKTSGSSSKTGVDANSNLKGSSSSVTVSKQGTGKTSWMYNPISSNASGEPEYQRVSIDDSNDQSINISGLTERELELSSLRLSSLCDVEIGECDSGENDCCVNPATVLSSSRNNSLSPSTGVSMQDQPRDK